MNPQDQPNQEGKSDFELNASQKETVTKFIDEEIDPFINKYQHEVDFNRFSNLGLIFASIGLGIGVTLSGIYDNPKLAASLGAASAGVQAALGFLPLEKRVWFYRTSVAEAKKIKNHLVYKADYTFEEVVDEFEALRTRTLEQEPLNSIPDTASPQKRSNTE